MIVNNSSDLSLYVWEKVGVWGVEIGVEIVPEKSLQVQIGVGWEKYKRINRIDLYIRLCENNCEIVDLIGNRYDEEHPFFHNKGMATCAVNTAIQFLLPLYSNPGQVSLSGKIAYVDDQWFSEEIQDMLARKRRNFWSRFGFSIKEDDGLRCKLSGLKIIDNGFMLDEFPRCIPKEEFTKDTFHKNIYDLFYAEKHCMTLRDVVPKAIWDTRPSGYSRFL